MADEPRSDSASPDVPPELNLSDVERLLVDHLSDGIVVTNNDAKIEYWSVGAEKMFGYSADEVAGKVVGEVLHPSLEGKYRLQIRESIEKAGFWAGEIPALCKDGTMTLCDSVLLPRLGDDGQVLGVVGVNRNVAWQSKAEAALAQQQETQSRLVGREAELAASLQRYKELIECIPDIVWAVDADGIITYMSPSTESVIGFKPEELVGIQFKDRPDLAAGPAGLDPMLHRFDSLLNPEHREDGFVARRVYQHADGRLIDSEVRMAPHLDVNGKVVGVIGITRDVGDIARAQQTRLALETKLMQAQKMEAIGQLAGGVAHDLNNVLTAIMGHTELLIDAVETSHSHFRGLTEIRESSQRAARLVKNLLAFSRQQELGTRVVDCCEVVAQMEEFVQGLLNDSIDLSIHIASEPLRVVANPTQLEQVVLNLITNARDAIPHSGQIRVVMESVQLGAQSVALLPEGQYVKLSVSDTGSGIESEAIPRVFEPFYTTKKQHQGTGLGLSSAYGIIQQSGGSIDVTSESGAGATFDVYLPLVSEALTEENLESLPLPLEASLKSVTVLIAEDNAEIGGMLKQMLELNGYSVLLDSNGEDALETARRTVSRIDLLITDYGMPGMSGFQLSREFALVHHEAKILHISGYGDDLLRESGRGESSLNFLSKPFGPRVLLERVRELLDGSD